MLFAYLHLCSETAHYILYSCGLNVDYILYTCHMAAVPPWRPLYWLGLHSIQYHGHGQYLSSAEVLSVATWAERYVVHA